MQEEAGGRDRGRIGAALQRFLSTEASSGILLLLAAAAALVWANLASGSYERSWSVSLTLGSGDWSVANDLRHWINEAAMAVFFFVVGLEIKRELVSGELRDRRTAALPIFGAIGGMLVPSLIYLAVNAGGGGDRGWGIPMATDIAFAVGVLMLFGSRVPPALKLFLLTLAIVDDIGAILVIAVAYTNEISIPALAIAIGLLAVYAVIPQGPRAGLLRVPVALAVWVAVSEAGVHATLAGVALALLTKADAAPRLEQALHPWTSYLIVPVFALANAGVVFDAVGFDEPPSVRVAAGAAIGLVVGKIVGITAGAAVATWLRLARLPAEVGWRQVIGAASLGGVGFTVSLFVAGLAFPDGPLLDAAKAGVLVGSVVAGLIGALILWRATDASVRSRR
ncbi:MAG: Na+/H+ antiporter NhaA [Actinomycetota bacterium]